MLQTLLLICSISFLWAMSPGPDFVVISKNTLIYGRKHGIYTSLWVALAILTHCLIVVIWLWALIRASALAYQVIKIWWALYLIYIWHQMRVSKSDNQAFTNQGNTADTIQTRSVRASIKNWYIVNIVNPKFIVFLLALFAQFFGWETSRLMYTLASIVVASTACARFWTISVLLWHIYIQKLFRRYLNTINKILWTILLWLWVKILTE